MLCAMNRVKCYDINKNVIIIRLHKRSESTSFVPHCSAIPIKSTNTHKVHAAAHCRGGPAMTRFPSVVSIPHNLSLTPDIAV